MSARSTTTGVCFDPAQAKIERAKRAEREAELARLAHQTDMRAHGRMLDQIETCYRQHTPAQILHEEEMSGFAQAERECLAAVRQGAQ